MIVCLLNQSTKGSNPQDQKFRGQNSFVMMLPYPISIKSVFLFAFKHARPTYLYLNKGKRDISLEMRPYHKNTQGNMIVCVYTSFILFY